MSSHSIRKFPEPVLRQISKTVVHFNSALDKDVKRLIKIMRSQPGGVGIAAPQIGLLKRIAIIDVSPKVPRAKLLILINPEIIKLNKEIVLREGCMSLPDYTANVRRFDELSAQWQDLDGKAVLYKTGGLEARCIQHEIDHLNGVLFVDRVASLNSDVFRRKRYL